MYEEAAKLRKILDQAMPKGSIVAEHTDTSHHYRVHLFEGSPLLDSVTSKTAILGKGYLKDWGIRLAIKHIRDNIPSLSDDNLREGILFDAGQKSQEVLDDAGEVGGRVHNIIEEYINDWINFQAKPSLDITSYIKYTEKDVRVLSCIKGVERFFNDHDIIPVHSEMLVASRSLGTAGTMDFLCYIKIDGVYKLAIVDWKTSNSIAGKEEYALQTAAYKTCLKELTSLDPELLWVIRLDKKTGTYEKGVVTDPEETQQAYELIAKLYDYINNGKDKLPIQIKEKKILKL